MHILFWMEMGAQSWCFTQNWRIGRESVSIGFKLIKTDYLVALTKELNDPEQGLSPAVHPRCSRTSAICIGIEVVKRAGRNNDWRINAAVFLIDYWEVL